MSIYSQSTPALMKKMVDSLGIQQGQVFTQFQVTSWFEEHYPKIKKGTVVRALIRLSTNVKGRVHYSPKLGQDDLFYQEKTGNFRLYDSATDPLPIYQAESPKSAFPTFEFPGDDPQDMGGAPHVAVSVFISEFSLMTFTHDGVSMTLEQLGQKVETEQKKKQTGLEAAAALMGWSLMLEFNFEPWRSYEPFEQEAEENRSISASEGKTKKFEKKGTPGYVDELWQNDWSLIRNLNRDYAAALDAHEEHPNLIAKATRPRVWCSRNEDPFEPGFPEEWRRELFALIVETPYLDWFLPTRWPEKIHAYQIFENNTWKLPFPNLCVGARVENQETADAIIPALLNVPLARHFILCEPLLGPVDLRDWIGERCRHCEGSGMHCLTCGYSGYRVPPIGQREPFKHKNLNISWVVVGGQCGPNSQPMHLGWARSLRDQCQTTRTTFFFSHTGSALADKWDSHSNDGSALNRIPEDLQIREYPHYWPVALVESEEETTTETIRRASPIEEDRAQ